MDGENPTYFPDFWLGKVFLTWWRIWSFLLKKKSASFQGYFHFRYLNTEGLCTQTFAFNVQSNDAQAEDLREQNQFLPLAVSLYERPGTSALCFESVKWEQSLWAVWGVESLRGETRAHSSGELCSFPQQVASRMDTLCWAALSFSRNQIKLISLLWFLKVGQLYQD